MPAQNTTQLTHAQQLGQACIGCGTSEPPLHPAETITVRVAEGVVRDVATARCTRCLVARPRYETVELQPDERERRRWAIKDTKTGQLVDDEGELVVFYNQRGADGWIDRQRYLDQTRMGRA